MSGSDNWKMRPVMSLMRAFGVRPSRQKIFRHSFGLGLHCGAAECISKAYFLHDMKVSIFCALSLTTLLVGCGKQIEIPLVMDKLFACEATRAGERDNNHGAMFVWARNGRVNFNFANMTDAYFAGTYSLEGNAFRINVLAEKFSSGRVFRLDDNTRYEGEFTEASAERFRISGVIKSDGEREMPVQMDCRVEKKS